MQEWDTKHEPAAKEPAPAKEPEKAKEAPAKAPAKDKEAPKELRARKEQLDGEVTTLNTKIKELEAKIAEAEAKGKDTASLTERLTAREKELEERDKLIRALKREEDPAFKEKWVAPFTTAAEIAKRSIERLMITNAETGEARKADFAKDFRPFFRSAVEEGGVIDIDGLKSKFGDGAQIALTHLNSLLEKNDELERAKAGENQRWEKELKDAEANEAKQREEMTNLRTKAFKYVEDSAEWFKENAEDAEHTELLNKGRAFVARQPKTPGEAALLQAEIFHRAAAHDLVLSRYEKVKAELDALKAENEELKASGPGTTRRDGGAKPASSGDEWEDTKREIREAANT